MISKSMAPKSWISKRVQPPSLQSSFVAQSDFCLSKWVLRSLEVFTLVVGSAYFKTRPWSLLTHWTPRRNTSRVRNHHQIYFELDCLYYLNTLLLQTLWKRHISSFYCYYTQRICLHRSAELPMPELSGAGSSLTPAHFLSRRIWAAPALLKVAVKKQRELGLTLLATHKCSRATTPD